MRDYKNQTSRPPSGEQRPAPQPRRPREPEPELEEEQEALHSAEDRGLRLWPWILLIIILLLSALVWWWIAQLPINTGKLGLLSKNSGSTAAAASASSNAKPATGGKSSSASSVALATAIASSAAPVSSTSKHGTAASTQSTAAAASTRSGVDFNFYQILPKMHVDIPADILGSGPGIPSASTNSTAAVAVHQPVTIQVGAFTNRAAAVVLRDRLALLGVSTSMTKVDGNGSNTLYRLQTQTFDSLADAQPTLAKIRGMGITPLLIGNGIIGAATNAPLSQSPAP
ncbi:sporulation protein [Acidithiobacillus thiooxidans]|uniref:Sporulation protein n=1 Tax=Acidithiobacillus thiooxidans TaxID=930 RepID=A0A1C2IKU5_ACITH|nr:SPOR domain-containing protein [Acidithiobacillus thiooxidans]OCX73602.1 sporulation protein [Acidithiobacillus thiooxidans]OCX76597.1 sporulation protein [Acidithiobacillus thiooxidans]OCX85198.1 sporulation protein [Acidithiobacillus thiooxidans]OCX88558.1 sporulation protein [Acidithiobacillus thiooxidans]OFC45422.1 sporulation protein [Acidithiobacillus thiooxidans]